MTGIKLAVAYLMFLISKSGIKHFNPELLEDIQEHPLIYISSCTAGLLTYVKLPNFLQINLISDELIKMIFAVLTTFLVIPLSFVLKKILEYLYNKHFKKYEKSNLSNEESSRGNQDSIE